MESYWINSIKENKSEFENLQHNESADVCIIGGGLTGLTAAYYLSKTNMNVVLLEKNKLCEHTSGNSTAKVTSQHGLIYDYLIKSQGIEKAKQYLKANQQAIKNIENIINMEKIDCDYERQNAYVYTNDEKEVEKIKKEINAVRTLGFNANFVNKIELNKPILAAIEFKDQAMFNPCKYAEGLIKSITKNKNINIYEKTKVVDINKTKDYKVITENGKFVSAKYVIMASHYPIINIPGYYFLKMYQSMSYAVAAEVQGELFKGMYINVEKPTYSFRTTKYKDKKVLIVVGMDHKTGEKKNVPNSYKPLEDVANELYPNCKILNKWCTEDCISLDGIPYIGEFSNIMKNVYVGTGYNKWGITTSNVAANIIVDEILKKENIYKDVFDSTRLEAIKNFKAIGNMVNDVTKSLIVEKLKIPKEHITDIKKGEGYIIEIEGSKVGIYCDENGKIYGVKPTCTHLGCELTWNKLDRTWDCPCHGSKFNYDGKSIYDPSIKNLIKIELE